MQSKGKGKQKKIQRGGVFSSPGETEGSYNETEDDSGAADWGEGSRTNNRPPGVKAAKKKASQNSALEDRIQASRERFARENEERMEETKEKNRLRALSVEYKKRELDLKQRDQDIAIMLTDTSNKSANEREFWENLKKEIMEMGRGSY